MLTLPQLVENNLQGRDRLVSRILNNPETVTKNVFLNLWFSEEVFLISSLVEQDFFSGRAHSYACSLLDIFRIVEFNERVFDYGLNHVSYVLLSDNEELIQRYSKLRYKKGPNAELSMDEMVALGESPIWCNTVQMFMSNYREGIEKNLNILETITLKKLPKKEELLKDDYAFYVALFEKDKAKMEELLEKLTSPAIHKKRNDNPVLSQYISHPATGYAKLAWRAGVHVEVQSPLVPKEMLPIHPNDKYDIPYDFLK